MKTTDYTINDYRNYLLMKREIIQLKIFINEKFIQLLLIIVALAITTMVVAS